MYKSYEYSCMWWRKCNVVGITGIVVFDFIFPSFSVNISNLKDFKKWLSSRHWWPDQTPVVFWPHSQGKTGLCQGRSLAWCLLSSLSGLVRSPRAGLSLLKIVRSFHLLPAFLLRAVMSRIVAELPRVCRRNCNCKSGREEYLRGGGGPHLFLQLYCPNGISPMGNSGCFSPGKASCDWVALHNLQCTLGVLVFP